MASPEWLVPNSSSSGAQTPGLVVGDLTTPYQMVNLGVGDSLVTADLSDGDTGDFSLTQAFAIEFLIQVSTAFGSDHTLIRGPAALDTPTRFQWYINLTSGGQLSFNAYDSAASLLRTVTFSTLMVLGDSYHVITGWNGSILWAHLNGVLMPITTMTSAPPPLDILTPVGTRGMVIQGPTSGTGFYHFDELAIYHHDVSANRARSHNAAAFSRGFQFDYVGPRITAILDQISSHAPRSVTLGSGSGRVCLPAYMTGQAPLDECLHAVEADDVDAAFFAAADGTLTFLPDGHRSSTPYNTSQVIFSRDSIPFTNMQTVDSSDASIVNEVNVTRSPWGPSTPNIQTASDATSISRYFNHSQSVTGVPVTSDAMALEIANGLLAKHKDPMTRVRSLAFDSVVPEVSDALLDRDLMDKVTINYQPPGGGTPISEASWIQKYELDISNDGSPWRWSLGVSPR